MTGTLESATAKKPKGYVTNSNLTLFGIATALFPRVFTSLKFPSPINFLHFAIYYFATAKSKPLWFRIAIVFACFNQIIISDTKQVLLSFIVGYVLLYLLNIEDLGKTITYLTVGVIFLGIFYWAIYNFAVSIEINSDRSITDILLLAECSNEDEFEAKILYLPLS